MHAGLQRPCQPRHLCTQRRPTAAPLARWAACPAHRVSPPWHPHRSLPLAAMRAASLPSSSIAPAARNAAACQPAAPVRRRRARLWHGAHAMRAIGGPVAAVSNASVAASTTAAQAQLAALQASPLATALPVLRHLNPWWQLAAELLLMVALGRFGVIPLLNRMAVQQVLFRLSTQKQTVSCMPPPSRCQPCAASARRHLQPGSHDCPVPCRPPPCCSTRTSCWSCTASSTTGLCTSSSGHS